jgi:hypothetical protein
MKGHLFFNMWCACTMLAEVLANIDTKCDVIIKDRGIFDTLIWLERQIRHGEVTEQEADRIRQFLLMDRWTRLVDLVVVVTAQPLVSIQRELKPRLSKEPGSIMNERTLTSINGALSEAVEKYRPSFNAIMVYDTTDSTARRTNIKIGEDVLDHFEQFLNPNIATLDLDVIRVYLFNSACNQAVHVTEGDLLTLIRSKGSFVRRSEAERRDDLVQVIACGVLTHADKIFLFKREDKDPKSDLYGTNTILQSGHISYANAPIEELILNRSFNVRFLRYTWDQGDPNKRRHLGLLYELEIDSEDVANEASREGVQERAGLRLVRPICYAGRAKGEGCGTAP